MAPKVGKASDDHLEVKEQFHVTLRAKIAKPDLQ